MSFSHNPKFGIIFDTKEDWCQEIKDFDPNAPNKQNLTHFYKVLSTDSLQVAEYLLLKKANANLQHPKTKENAFGALTSLKDKKEVFKKAELLLAHKCDVNVRNIIGSTPLLSLTKAFNSKKIYQLFVENKADANVRDSFGNHCLNYAIMNRSDKHSLIDLIMENQTVFSKNVMIKEKSGEMIPFEYYCYKRGRAFAELAIKRGAYFGMSWLDEKARKPTSLFEICCQEKNHSFLPLLIQKSSYSKYHFKDFLEDCCLLNKPIDLFYLLSCHYLTSAEELDTNFVSQLIEWAQRNKLTNSLPEVTEMILFFFENKDISFMIKFSRYMDPSITHKIFLFLLSVQDLTKRSQQRMKIPKPIKMMVIYLILLEYLEYNSNIDQYIDQIIYCSFINH